MRTLETTRAGGCTANVTAAREPNVTRRRVERRARTVASVAALAALPALPALAALTALTASCGGAQRGDGGVDGATATDAATGSDVRPGPDVPSGVDVTLDARGDAQPGLDVPVPTDVPVTADVPVPTDVRVAADVPVADVPRTDVPVVPPPAACAAAMGGGRPATMTPTLLATLADRWHEGWLASPAVADLDRDGTQDIIVARAGRLLVWRPNATLRWFADIPGGGRIWASPLVADFTGDANLEVVVAARGAIYMYNAAGTLVPGFPAMWRDEIRSLAAGDVDGDGRLEIVAVTTSPLAGASMLRDIIQVFRADGTVQRGYPPNTTGTSMCTTACYVTGGYDQNVAVGPIDGDGSWDIFTGQDNAYLSWHRGNGVAFTANSIFRMRPTVLGIRFLHDYALAQQGWAPDEATANQAHFTNSAPAIADIDANGTNDLVVLGSVQNAAQTDRLRGVALWVLNSDGSRPATWVSPYHVPAYLAGLWDFMGTNVVAATNQVSIADLDPTVPGLDMIFAGFDGRIHLVGADRRERWNFVYTTANNVLTGGVAVADLSGDGSPEVIFASYSPTTGLSALYILNAAGALQHRIALPARGAMAVPTVADVNGDGTLEIVVGLKDGEDRMRSALVYTVPGSSTNCMPWPTGRANLLRNGYVRLR